MSEETNSVVSEKSEKTVDERAVALVTSAAIPVGNRGQLTFQTESALDIVGVEVDAGLEIVRFTAGKSSFKRSEAQSWKDVLVAPDNRIPADVFVMILVENHTGEEVVGKGTLVLANEAPRSPSASPLINQSASESESGQADVRTSGQAAERQAPREVITKRNVSRDAEAGPAPVVIRRGPTTAAAPSNEPRRIRMASNEKGDRREAATPITSAARLERLSHQVAPNPGERAICLLSMDVMDVSNWLDGGLRLLARARSTLAFCLSQEPSESASAMGDNEVVVSIGLHDAEKLRAYAMYESPELSADQDEDAEIRVRLSKAFHHALELDVEAPKAPALHAGEEAITVHASAP